MQTGKVEGVIHKWFNAYGEGQHTHPVRKAVPCFILCALYNKPVTIWGDGLQTVDMIYMEDIAYLAVETMNKKEFTMDKVIEIGRGIEVTVMKLAQDIIRLTKSTSKISHNPMRSGEISNTKLVADISGINKYIQNDYKFYDYEQGLLNTIDYYRTLPQENISDFFKFYGL